MGVLDFDWISVFWLSLTTPVRLSLVTQQFDRQLLILLEC